MWSSLNLSSLFNTSPSSNNNVNEKPADDEMAKLKLENARMAQELSRIQVVLTIAKDHNSAKDREIQSKLMKLFEHNKERRDIIKDFGSQLENLTKFYIDSVERIYTIDKADDQLKAEIWEQIESQIDLDSNIANGSAHAHQLTPLNDSQEGEDLFPRNVLPRLSVIYEEPSMLTTHVSTSTTHITTENVSLTNDTTTQPRDDRFVTIRRPKRTVPNNVDNDSYKLLSASSDEDTSGFTGFDSFLTSTPHVCVQADICNSVFQRNKHLSHPNICVRRRRPLAYMLESPSCVQKTENYNVYVKMTRLSKSLLDSAFNTVEMDQSSTHADSCNAIYNNSSINSNNNGNSTIVVYEEKTTSTRLRVRKLKDGALMEPSLKKKVRRP